MPVTLILSAGFDSCRLLSREQALISAGHLVESSFLMNDAVHRFLSGDFDLVLLCDSMPAKDRDRLAALIRASGSQIPIVSVVKDATKDFASTASEPADAFSDAILTDEKVSLLSGISSILASAAARHAAISRRHDHTLWAKLPLWHDDQSHLEQKIA